MNTVEEIFQRSLKIFQEINKIPRCSKQEEKIRLWIIGELKKLNIDYTEDDTGNIIAYIPSKDGNSYSYILQSHMDMVCNKVDGSNHDFTKDPIKTSFENDWIKSGETTLGADNGIGIAIMLAIASLSTNLDHPGIELLFTVDEETGLTGASNLPQNILRGKYLINLDSEDEGVITIGCAGSADIEITKTYSTNSTSKTGLKVTITGGRGGHSGVDIHKKIANTNILMARLLNKIKEYHLEISTIKGGTVRNGITSKTEAVMCINDIKKVNSIIENFKKVIKTEFAYSDPNLDIDTETIQVTNTINTNDSKEVINTMLLIPHGILSMSATVKGLVETSNNFAIVNLKNGNLELVTMARSSINTQRDYVIDIIKALGTQIKATVNIGSTSSAWEPQPNSTLLAKAVDAYQSLTGNKPIVEAIHAGLECAVIGEKHKNMEMISIGPTIKNAHTPEEKLYVPSVKTTIKWLLEILKSK